ncbi:FAD/FMN-containing dehydrogenase [Streptomyces sp. Ncost-T6T-1]|uniref:FAD-binding oxidoreductase n=1 Tax=Streptomyces sp. Ncost-T6T-1 TaxID=1100828 RepID=UPI00080495DC|nr:FAD-binding oxidoreductase [Streptomyces sp. Ncost-T6T-1]SBU91161.1 FAD/FMN-containing dehydrogenase [Streptomyces sp. Ncost-T6T-1]
MSLDVEILAAEVRGPVLLPGGRGYDEERAGFQTGFRHRPAVVVGATRAEDVRAAVRFAAERRLPVAVQSTGHGIVTALDGEGLLITTRRMKAVTVDAEARTVSTEAGVLWGEVIQQAAPHGLAPVNGSAPHIGVVGYLLGGGIGLLGRLTGYAGDHVRSVDIVTADGTPRHVTADSDPDLFWALRGGGGNFGAVTAIETALLPVARLYGGGLHFAADHPIDLLHAYRGWTLTLPEELTSSIALMACPQLPSVPEPLRGRYVAHVRIAFTGSAEQGERLVAPLRALGPRLIDTVREMPYTEVGSIYQDPQVPHAYFGGNVLLRELDPAALRAIVDVAGPGAAVPCIVDIRHLGGAFVRRPADAGAVGGREAAYMLRVMTGGAAAPPTAARPVHQRVYDALKPWTVGRSLNSVYNDGHPVLQEQVRELFAAEDFERLRCVKTRHDPHNLFRLTHNIPPADSD